MDVFNPPKTRNVEKTELGGTGEALIPVQVLDQLDVQMEESSDGDQTIPFVTIRCGIGGCDVEVQRQ